MKAWSSMARRAKAVWKGGNRTARRALGCVRGKMIATRGQGTTEYAILVGVLVVIAILAIALFKPKIEELWNGIVSGFQKL